MTLQQLNYVIVISETGSMNKAAELLYIAQPSLTSAVKELEKEIGIIIFNRSGRGVTLTADGEEFLSYARQVYQQYEAMRDRYTGGNIRKKFGISTQHYSFAVEAFVDMVKEYGTAEYDLAIRETKTAEVIEDVKNMKSEIGVLYLSDFNRQIMTKLFQVNHLEFHSLIKCRPCVYIWNEHPLAEKKSVSMAELADYPCLTFEQGDKSSFYYAEEIFSVGDLSRVIHACDRSTMLNLMKGLNGYTFCSGIICGKLNGPEYVALPIEGENDLMEIGYVTLKSAVPTELGLAYAEKLKEQLDAAQLSLI